MELGGVILGRPSFNFRIQNVCHYFLETETRKEVPTACDPVPMPAYACRSRRQAVSSRDVLPLIQDVNTVVPQAESRRERTLPTRCRREAYRALAPGFSARANYCHQSGLRREF